MKFQNTLNYIRHFWNYTLVVLVTGVMLVVLQTVIVISPVSHVSAATGLNCSTDNKFLGIFPAWYAYFGKDYGKIPSNNSFLPDPTCGVIGGSSSLDVIKSHTVQIGLAVIDMLLRAGALVAVAYIMMGGYRYISSQGEPKNIEVAMATIINAVIGLGIVLLASVIVSYIGVSVLK